MKTTISRITTLVLIVILSPGAQVEAQQIRSGYLRAGQERLYYEEAGSGPAIVLLHDGLVHSEGMRAQLHGLSNGYRVISYDRRGFGRSDTPDQRYSPLGDLESVLDGLDVDKAVLIGASSGGGGAIDFALADPDRVSGLVLVGPVVSGYGYSEHFQRRGAENMAPLATGDYRAAMRNWIDDQYLLAPESGDARERLWSLMAPFAEKNLTNPFDLAEPPAPAVGRLTEIHVPTLIVVGEADVPDVHAHTGVIENGIAGSQRVIMADAGHLVFFERPHEFNRLVLTFLDQIAW